MKRGKVIVDYLNSDHARKRKNKGGKRNKEQKRY